MKKLLVVIALLLVFTLSGCESEKPPCDNVVQIKLEDESTYIYEDVCNFYTTDLAFDGAKTMYAIRMHSYNQKKSETVYYESRLVKAIGYIQIQEEVDIN